MPKDIAHFKPVDIRPFALAKPRTQSAVTAEIHAKSRAVIAGDAALTKIAFRDLVLQNGDLERRNKQLKIALDALQAAQKQPAAHMAQLTPRQQQIMALVLAGHPSKNIAADLNISQRTVENHRAAIMQRTGAVSIPALVRLSLA